eukprot:s5219_g3.t1
MIKNVRVLTLPYLEFEFCNVYRGTQGKTFPLIHRHPDAVVLLWCKGDHDHLLPCLQDMNLADWSMVVFWNESAGSGSKKGPDVALDFTDQPAPSPHVSQQPPATPGDDLDYPGYDDPHVDMPVDDEDMPPPNSAPEPDLDDDPIELGSVGNPPPHPPGSGIHVPVPGGEGDEDLDMPHYPDEDGGHPPGGGPQGPGPGYGPSPDEPALPMEYHEESPPPGGAQSAYAVAGTTFTDCAQSAYAVAGTTFTDYDTSKAKSRTVVGPPVVLLPGQSAGKKDPPSTGDFPGFDEPASSSSAPAPVDPPSTGDFPGFDEPASSSSAPAPVPGLPVTEGDFPIQQTPLPEPTAEPPAPEDGEDTDSDATVDYRGDSLLALVAGDDDVLIRLPESFEVPSFVPLDGDGFASWLTKQDKIKAGTITQEMQRKYAKEIRAAKLEEFKSYLDNDAIRLTDRRRLNRDVNFLTGRWVLPVKVDKNGY